LPLMTTLVTGFFAIFLIALPAIVVVVSGLKIKSLWGCCTD
jgi:hypothetical protein